MTRLLQLVWWDFSLYTTQFPTLSHEAAISGASHYNLFLFISNRVRGTDIIRRRVSHFSCFSLFFSSLHNARGKTNISKFNSQLLWHLTASNEHQGFRKPASRKGMETNKVVDDYCSFSVWNEGSRMKTTDEHQDVTVKLTFNL